MNSIVIKTKLESLRKCLDRIESKKPETLDVLLQDIDIQDIIALNLERSVQFCVDIANHILSALDDSPAMSMAESFERLSEKEIIFDAHPIGYNPLSFCDPGLGCIIPIILFLPRASSTIEIYLGSNMFKGKLPLGKTITPGRGKIGNISGNSL